MNFQSSTAKNFLFFFLIVSLSCIAYGSSLEDNFLQCLSQNCQNTSPISEAICTPNNVTFTSTLQSYIRNLRVETTTPLKPLAIIAAKHESHMQAVVKCSKQLGL